MSLAKLLRKRKITETTGRVYITDLLDREVLRPRPAFSWRRVLRIAKEFARLLAGDHTRDEAWMLFFELQDALYAPPKRADNVFHPSSLMNDCERKLFYDLSKVTPTNETTQHIGAQTQRIFDTGTWWHTYVQFLLKRAGVLVQAEVPVRNKKRKLQGSGDGELCFVAGFPDDAERFLLEVKTINSRGYMTVKTAPYEYHRYQAGIYAHELGIKQIYFLYINKDTCEWCEHLIAVDDELLRKAHKKMDSVINAIEEDELPDRICASKVSKPALSCAFCTRCFKDPA